MRCTIFSIGNHLKALALPSGCGILIIGLAYLYGSTNAAAGAACIYGLVLIPILLLHLDNLLFSFPSITYSATELILQGLISKAHLPYRAIQCCRLIGVTDLPFVPSAGHENYFFVEIKTCAGKNYYVSCLTDRAFMKHLQSAAKSVPLFRKTSVFPSIAIHRLLQYARRHLL